MSVEKNRLPGVLLFGGILLLFGFHNVASALTFQTTESIEFTFNPTISISLSDSNLIIDNLTPSSSGDSNIITVDIATNASYGYYMSATVGTSSGNTNLTSTTDSNAIFTNLSSNVATLNAIPDNSWGYSYSTDNGTTWISGSQGSTSAGYNGLPLDNDDSGATGVKLIDANSFSNSSSIKFKIGAKAAATQSTGIYTNTINFYTVASVEPTPTPVPCVAGKICYNDNSISAATGTMGQQTASDGATVTLLASNFSRTGYGFAGWNTSYDYSGTFYGPNEDITVPNGTTASGLSLYAVWVRSAGSIQTDASRICANLTTAPVNGTATLASVSALTDQRDNQTYAIAKLADGNCWMIENLRLEAENTRSAANKDLAQGYGLSSTYGNFSGLADSESTNFTSNPSSIVNSLYYSGTQSGTATINIGTSDSPSVRIPRYNNANTASRASNPTSNIYGENTNGGMYSYGNYYSWSAAMATTISYYDPTVPDADGKYSDTVNTSLCPTGWRLPYGKDHNYGSTSGGFSYLDSHYGGSGTEASSDTTPTGAERSNAWRRFPYNYIYNGRFVSNLIELRGRYGFYWTSTSYWSTAYNLYFSSINLAPGSDINQAAQGSAVRCVLVSS